MFPGSRQAVVSEGFNQITMEAVNESRSKAEIDEDVQRLKDWILKQPHLPKDFDDKIILPFAIQCKSLEIAKRKLDSFFSYRNKLPEYFDCPNRDVLEPAFKEACEFTQIFFLPESTPEGYRVLMIRGANDDKFDHTLNNLRMLLMVETAMDMWPDMAGIIGLIDAEGKEPAILPKINMPLSVKGVHYVQNSLPLRVKNVIVFSSSKISEFLVNVLIKPLLSRKVAERFAVTSEGVQFIEKYLPRDILPSDYPGGKAPTVKELNDQWIKTLEDRRDWCIELGNLRSDESKRPPDSLAAPSDMDGSFKYLSVD